MCSRRAVLIVLGAAGPVPPLAVVALAGAAASTLAGVRLLLPYAGVPAPVRLAVGVALGLLAVDALAVLTGAGRDGGTARCRGGSALTLFALVLLAGLPAGPAGHGRCSHRSRWRSPPSTSCEAGLLPDRTAVLLALAVVPPLVVRQLVDTAAATSSDESAAARTRCPRRHRTADPGGSAGRAGLLRALAARPEPACGALLVVDLHLTELPGRLVRDDVAAEAVRRARAVAADDGEVFDLTGTGLAVVSGSGAVLAYALGTRLLTALSRPYEVAGAVLRSRPSIGLTELGSGQPEDLFRQADLARRRAAQLGRDRVEWYDAYLEEQLVRRLDLERELPGAVARGELDLVYQPVLSLADRAPVAPRRCCGGATRCWAPFSRRNCYRWPRISTSWASWAPGCWTGPVDSWPTGRWVAGGCGWR